MATKKNTDLLDSIGDDNENALLDDISDSEAERWAPTEAGDGVEGVVTEIFDLPDKYDDDERVPVFVLRQSDGTDVQVAGFRKVLRQEMRKNEPVEGDTWACRYLGSKKSNDRDNPIYIYKSKMRRAAGNSAPAAVPVPAPAEALSEPPF